MLPKFLEVADELDGAMRRMNELGFSSADIEEEMDRIRARHAKGPASPYEDAARQAKAHNIAMTIWRGLDDSARRDVRTGWLLREAGDSFRQQFARLAGHRIGCSGKCWALVVETVCGMVNAERRSAPEPCRAEWAFGPCEDGMVYHTEGEDPCTVCHGTGKRLCDNCGEAPATQVVPLGFYCPPCATANG